MRRVLGCVLAVFCLCPALLLWYLTAELFDPSEYVTAKVAQAGDFKSLNPVYSEEVENISAGGKVTLKGLGRPAVGVTVLLNFQVEVTTNGDGYYEFASVSVTKPAGIPPGTFILTGSGPNLRTKMIRLTRARKSPGPGANGVAADFQRLDFTMSETDALSLSQPFQDNAIEANDSAVGVVMDQDQDGIDDVCEDWLAERFAPIVYHGQYETNYPVTVDWWIARTNLSVIDRDGNRHQIVPAPVSQSLLLGQTLVQSRDVSLSSELTRSRGKKMTFYLENVARQFRQGQKDDPAAWITYVHSYANDIGGITIQYWRGYTWDQATFLGCDFSHGGDWEGVAVHLGSRLRPAKVAFLGHSGIIYERTRVQWDGTHPRVWSEEGGHSSYPDDSKMKSPRFIAQETWTGGKVRWWDGSLRGRSGGLLSLGQKSHPRNSQNFVKYAGLWGAPRRLFFTSGYWGPAFNETDATYSDGTPAYGRSLSPGSRPLSGSRIFITAWCDSMNGRLLDLSRECYPAQETP
ncbi:MAG TPA: hypothetical protein VJX67_00340 [Blastocatellia bacterium]|nr:hypothetical protein [Blastocatellia bacterium]